ncbi:MAG: hypothetical protein Q9186_006693 [Xanthomendoza sp. 1 TL-2023]
MAQMFEFIVGHPPFDTIMANRDGLIREWVAMFGPLPDEWGHHLPSPGSSSEDLDEVTLSDWLHECYFDDDKPAGFAEAHIENDPYDDYTVHTSPQIAIL